MNDIKQFGDKKKYAICVDSDGCTMDSMTVKHVKCFGPCIVDEWGLLRYEKEILNRWNVMNLYSMTRGMNRFKGLLMMLEELKAAGIISDDLMQYKNWVDTSDELSANNLKKRIDLVEDKVLKKALSWSNATNEKIKALPKDSNVPFQGVKEALKHANQYATIVIVSSANGQSVQEEWQHYGLLSFVDIVMTQEHGSKASCIAKVISDGFEREKILMIGDAPGDRDAAMCNGILYYPILAGKETASWNTFVTTILYDFLKGNYRQEEVAEWIAEFEDNLK